MTSPLPPTLRWRIRRATLRDIPALVHHRRGMFEDMGIASAPADDRRYASWARRRLRAGTLKKGRGVYRKLGWNRSWEREVRLR